MKKKTNKKMSSFQWTTTNHCQNKFQIIKDDPDVCIFTTEYIEEDIFRLLKQHLMKNANVLFVGFDQPHPQLPKNNFVLKMKQNRTTRNVNHVQTPRNCILEAIDELSDQMLEIECLVMEEADVLCDLK